MRKPPCIEDAYWNGANEMPPNEGEGAIQEEAPCIEDAYWNGADVQQ